MFKKEVAKIQKKMAVETVIFFVAGSRVELETSGL